MSLNNGGVGAEGLLAAAGALAGPSDQYGNDSRVEALWAMKAMEHAEVYFNILCSVEPSQIPRLTNSGEDEEIYSSFRKEFPDMAVENLEELRDLKSEEMKDRWRKFCENFKAIKDYNFATLLRLDSSGEYCEANSILVTKVQFYAIELARNREGHNDSIRHKFKATPRRSRKTILDNNSKEPSSGGSLGGPMKDIEQELLQILSGNHPYLKE